MRMVQLLGPGVLMATAAVGGSHLVASTQAGAKFGWQLVVLILAVNVLKYPFFSVQALAIPSVLGKPCSSVTIRWVRVI